MVGVMLGVCSLMGLPWFVAATVLSISHVNSLKLESECSAPGEQPKFLGIREQRVTGLMIFLLMGCSVFMTSVLKVWNSMNKIFIIAFTSMHLADTFIQNICIAFKLYSSCIIPFEKSVLSYIKCELVVDSNLKSIFFKII